MSDPSDQRDTVEDGRIARWRVPSPVKWLLVAVVLVVGLVWGVSRVLDSGSHGEPVTAPRSVQLTGLHLHRAVCPEPQSATFKQPYRRYRPVTGTVREYIVCRRGWFDPEEPDIHVTTADATLLAEVVQALSVPDRTTTSTSCPQGSPTGELPGLLVTSNGAWLVRQPRVPCGTALQALVPQLEALTNN